MDLGSFLETHIDHYLFGDIENMSYVGVLPGRDYGSLGLTHLQVILTGVTMLGRLLWDGSDNEMAFKRYWNKCLSKTAPRNAGFADMMWAVKEPLDKWRYAPYLYVFKTLPQSDHLTVEDDRLLVSTAEMADDLIRSYIDIRQPRLLAHPKAVLGRIDTWLHEGQDPVEPVWETFKNRGLED